jgi:hypothetical protein
MSLLAIAKSGRIIKSVLKNFVNSAKIIIAVKNTLRKLPYINMWSSASESDEVLLSSMGASLSYWFWIRKS